MDKSLVNHQIVSMRKNVKNAKNQVYRKLFKQINQIKKKIAKWENVDDSVDGILKQRHLKELNKKLQIRQHNATELKSITPDTLSKHALKHQPDYFDSVLQKPNISAVDRLMAQICKHRLIQSSVKKFRQENPDCDEWLPVQLELWEEKRRTKTEPDKKNNNKNRVKVSKNDHKPKQINKPNSPTIKINDKSGETLFQTPSSSKKLKTEKRQTPRFSAKKSPKSFIPTFTVTEMTPESVTTSPKSEPISISSMGDNSNHKLPGKSPKSVNKRIDLSDLDSLNQNVFEDKDVDFQSSPKKTETSKNQINITPRKTTSKFFLSGSDDDNESNHVEPPPKKHPKSTERPVNGKRFQNDNQNSPKFGNRFSNKTPDDNRNKRFSHGKLPPTRYFNQQQIESGPSENHHKNDAKKGGSGFVHPSWKAKMEAREKQKVSFIDDASSRPNKHIKFD